MMRRLAILSVLIAGVPLIGCTDMPTTAGQQAELRPESAIPQADPDVVPTGSHIRGVAPDPFTIVVGKYDIDTAPGQNTSDALLYSRAWPFLNIRNH
jgi:hypothetical protein